MIFKQVLFDGLDQMLLSSLDLSSQNLIMVGSLLVPCQSQTRFPKLCTCKNDFAQFYIKLTIVFTRRSSWEPLKYNKSQNVNFYNYLMSGSPIFCFERCTTSIYIILHLGFVNILWKPVMSILLLPQHKSRRFEHWKCNFNLLLFKLVWMQPLA